MKQLFYLTLSFLVIVFLFMFSSPKPAFAAVATDPNECTLDSITVNGQVYLSVNTDNPIPQFQDFYLNMSCISNDPSNRGQVEATLFATVNGQQNNALLNSGSGVFPAKATIGPYNGLPGDFFPQYAKYTVTTSYMSRFTGGGTPDVPCSMVTSACAFLVVGDGIKPSPPSGGDFCPVFKAFNPDPPVVNQSFQLQYNLPPNGSTSESYEFHWTEKDGTTGVSPVNKLTAPAYGIWVGTFIFNQETEITLFMIGPRGEANIPCDSQTVFSGITVSPLPKGWSGKNPCVGGTCSTAIGYIPTNLGGFASAVLRIALGISGGIVLILMVIGSIRVMTSSGDPQRVAAGRDMIIAALTGALFIAFSVMIMQFLGTAVVPIPGLVFGT